MLKYIYVNEALQINNGMLFCSYLKRASKIWMHLILVLRCWDKPKRQDVTNGSLKILWGKIDSIFHMVI